MCIRDRATLVQNIKNSKKLKKGKLFFKTIQFTFLYHVNWLKLNLDIENPYIIFFNNGNVSENMKKWPKVCFIRYTRGSRLSI